MAIESLHIFWKQILLGGYAAVTAVRGCLMLLRPRVVLGWMRRTIKRVIEWCFRIMGRAMPRVDHEHQVMIVRVLGVLSLCGAGVLVWWLMRR